MKERISVKAVVRKVDEILIVSTDGSEYYLPGCQLTVGADPKSMLREAFKEQTGLQVNDLKILDAVSLSTGNTPELCLLYQVDIGEQILPKDCRYIPSSLISTQQLAIEKDTRNLLEKLFQKSSQETIRQPNYQGGDKKTTRYKKLLIYTDGGSRGNPGPSAAAFRLLDSTGTVIYKHGEYLGITTNNQAEYQAVKLSLEKALDLGATVVDFMMDSLLVVNQLQGIYKIKNRDLWPIYTYIKELITRFHKVTFTHVAREFNKEADRLVNQVLDEHGY